MKTRRKMAALNLVLAALFASACSAETEIGNSGVTFEELERAAEVAEANEPEERPEASVDGVDIWATLCEITEAELRDDGVRRRVWIRIANSRPEILSVTADSAFTDGLTMRSDPTDVGAFRDGEPGSNTFGTHEGVETSVDRLGDDCFGEIDSISIVEIGDPVWMTEEDDLATRD